MGKSPEVLLIGAGGHASVLVDTLRAVGVTSLGVIDGNAAIGSLLLDAPVVGNDDAIPELHKSGARYFVIGVAGARDNTLRARLFDQAVAHGLEPLTVVHPRATVSSWATLEPGCQVLAGAIVNARAQLMANVIVNTSSVVEHDCVLGKHAHVATGARLTGGVNVGAYAHIGAGAIVRQLITIGEGAVVGAGAVVVANVEAGIVVAGVPAKELK